MNGDKYLKIFKRREIILGPQFLLFPPHFLFCRGQTSLTAKHSMQFSGLIKEKLFYALYYQHSHENKTPIFKNPILNRLNKDFGFDSIGEESRTGKLRKK